MADRPTVQVQIPNTRNRDLPAHPFDGKFGRGEAQVRYMSADGLTKREDAAIRFGASIVAVAFTHSSVPVSEDAVAELAEKYADALFDRLDREEAE